MSIGSAALRASTACLLAGASILSDAKAGDFDVTGDVELQLRAFPQAPLYANQFQHWQPSVAVTPKLRWRSGDERHSITIEPFARLDSQDDARTHLDLREAYYRYVSDDNWSLTLGLERIFWGKAESRHLVDIINQVDGVEDVDEEDRLGQPMAHLALMDGWGQLDVFVMSGFRLRTFSGKEGRLRLALPVDNDAAEYEREGRRAAPDFAVRYSHYLGPVDFGFSAFHGTSREPRFAVDIPNDRLAPLYDKITQFSFDGQATLGSLLLKTETFWRDDRFQQYVATVSGAEYTLHSFAGSPIDVGLMAEYQRDGRDDSLFIANGRFETAAPIVPFNDAAFGGARLGFNDTRDSSLVLGLTTDLSGGSTLFSVEGSSRIAENWTAGFVSRLFTHREQNEIIRAIRADDFLTFQLVRRF